ncbi:MAG: hypothetical protein M4579_002329 [Chaenotheca gracillima]|nr:MAG: hypothetical protein M4579_002329 [Chaenotheca gracillima]
MLDQTEGQPPHEIIPHAVDLRSNVNSNNRSTVSPASLSIADFKSNPVLLEVLPYGGTGSSVGKLGDLLVVFENGEISCFSGDLKDRRWTAHLRHASNVDDDQQSSTMIEFAKVTNAGVLSRGLLKDRQDVLASLGLHNSVDPRQGVELPALAIVSRNIHTGNADSSERMFQVLSIRPAKESGTTKNRGSIQTIFSSKLPNSTPVTSKINSISFDPSSGIMQEISSGDLIAYDVSTTVASFSPPARIRRNPTLSFLSLSGSLVILATHREISAYDLEYQALQASVDLTDMSSPNLNDRKRKLGQAEATSAGLSIELHYHFAGLGLAVGISGKDLIGIPTKLSVGSSDNKRKKGGGKLLSVIGRGLNAKDLDAAPLVMPTDLPAALGQYFPACTTMQSSQWREEASQLDQCVEKRDVSNFDRLFAQYCGTSFDDIDLEAARTQEDESNSGKNSIFESSFEQRGSFENTSAADGSKKRKRPHHKTPPNRAMIGPSIPLDKILFALSKIFRWSSSSRPAESSKDLNSDGILKIIFYPPKTVNWLMHTGAFSAENVEMAFRQDQSSPRLSSYLSLSKFVDSIVEQSPDFKLLYALLRSPSHLGVEHTARALLLLIRALKDQPPNQNSDNRLLTNGNRSKGLTNGKTSAKMEKSTPAEQGPVVTSVDVREQALDATFERLVKFSATSVTKTFKTHLKREEVLDLIERLRFELSRDGWIYHCLDDEPEALSPASGKHHRVVLLGDLLNIAIDSLGTSGWLSSSGSAASQDTTVDLISQIRYEISAALEGLEEAAYLEGLFAELLRYEKSAVKAAPKKPTTTTSNAPMIVQTQNPDEKLLPLGLKAVQDIPRTRIGAGGEVQTRTMRDIGHLKSMRVGKYSLERIMI